MLARLKKPVLTLMGATLFAHAALYAAAAHAQFESRNFRVCNGVGKDHPMGDGLAAMGACTLDKSGGKMKIQPFWDGALGSDLTCTQSVRTGSIDMVLTSVAPVASIVPPLGVLELPFLFTSAEEADQLLDGPVGDWFAAKLPAVGAVNLAWWENGFRHITNSRRPINKLEDFPGLKMRVMQNNVYLDTFKLLGSNAVPLAFTEVYTALETRTVDGQENPLMNIQNMKFYEVQKYLTLSKHAYSPTLVLFSKKVWDGLSAPEQSTLQDCAVVGRSAQRQANRAKEAQSVDYLRAQGLAVNEIAPAELQRIREQTRAVQAMHAKAIGQDAIDRVFNELDRIRAK